MEVNGINTIAEEDRRGRPRDLFQPWFAGNISVLAMSYGAWVLPFGAAIPQTLLAVAAGVVVSFLLVGFAALAGQRGSAPTMVLSRAAFGVRGNAAPTLLAYLSLVFWEIVLVSLAVLMSRTVAARLGADGSTAMALTFAGVVLVVVAAGIHGFEVVMRVQRWLAWLTGALTLGYLALVAGRVDVAALAARPGSGPVTALGVFVFCLTGFGLTWVTCAADYSRYLPRDASGRGVVGWTTLGATLPILALTVGGLALAGSDRDLAQALALDPVGALTSVLPTWYVAPFALVALLGLVSAAILDIYSSGLVLLTLGLPVQRWQAVALDGVLMSLGTAYVVWRSEDFLEVFQAALYTLGVPLAAWAGVFLADLALRHAPYDEAALHRADGAYGAINPVAIAALAVGTLLGWGLLGQAALPWAGYLLGSFGGRDGAVAASGLGVLLALAVGFVVTLAAGRSRVRAQEAGVVSRGERRRPARSHR